MLKGVSATWASRMKQRKSSNREDFLTELQLKVEMFPLVYGNCRIPQSARVIRARPQHTTARLSEYFKKVTNRRTYAEWMEQTIKDHMKPGEKGLVVCKQALFENQNVPTWPQGDPRFDKPESYAQDYEWDNSNEPLKLACWRHTT